MKRLIWKLQIIEEISHNARGGFVHLHPEPLLFAEPPVSPDLVIGEVTKILGAVPVGGDQEICNGLPPEVLLGQIGAEESPETRKVVHVSSHDQHLDVLAIGHLETVRQTNAVKCIKIKRTGESILY